MIVLLAFILAACRGEPGLLRPNSAVQAADGSIYVNDFGNHRVVKLDSDGKVLMSFGRLGERTDQLYRSWDLTLGPDANLYLINFVEDDIRIQHDEVKVFSADGKFLKELARVDYVTEVGEETDAYKPYGLEFDQRGNLYLADYLKNTARVFASDGRLLTTLFVGLPTERAYDGLNDLAIDDTRGLLYAVAFNNNRLDQYRLRYDAAGVPQVEWVQMIANYGRSAKHVAFPQYLAVDDESGRLYVGDTGNRSVKVFDHEGEYVMSIGAPGVSEWQIMGISLGPGGDLIVTDAYNNAVWVFTGQGMLKSRLEVAK
jgi:DNA-binding beta-propeller fold protein YncE